MALIIYALLNIFMELKYPESEISLGGAVARGILGLEMIAETFIHRRENRQIAQEGGDL